MRQTTKRRLERIGPATITCAGTMLLALATAAGCGGDDNGGPPAGGGGDAGSDVTNPHPDAGPGPKDSGPDTTQPPIDSGQDTGNGGDTGPGDDGGNDSGSTCSDNGGALGTVTKVASGSGTTFTTPLDAVPDSAGANVYFTALAADGTGAVFSVATSGGGATMLSGGLGLPSSIALSDDGATLFVVDDAWPSSPSDRGAIVKMGTGAGTPTVLAGTDGWQPRGVATSGGDVVFSGIDPANGKPGVFRVATGGGSVSVIHEGAPFGDPSGVAMTKAGASGTIYVLDSVASSYAAGALYAIGSSVTTIAGNVYVGYPAGLATSADDSALLASSMGASGGSGQLALFAIPAGTAGTPVTAGAIATSTEPAGLHRASGGCSYAFVDSAGGGFGAVYLLTK